MEPQAAVQGDHNFNNETATRITRDDKKMQAQFYKNVEKWFLLAIKP